MVDRNNVNPLVGGGMGATRERAEQYVSSLRDEEVIRLDALLSYLVRKRPQAQIPLETSDIVGL